MKRKKKARFGDETQKLAVAMFIVFVAVAIFGGMNMLEAEESNLAKFAVTYSVKYNSLTLEEAADKEHIFRNKFKDACKVEVEVEQASGLIVSDGEYLIFDTTSEIFELEAD